MGENEQLDEELDAYTDEAAATTAFAAAQTYFKTCTGLSLDGATLALAPLTSIAGAGDESGAMEATGSVKGTAVAIDLAFARQGSLIVAITHVAGAPIDSSITSDELTAGISKLS